MATATASKKKIKLNIRPLGDRIIVQRDEAEERTEAGIYLPEQAKDTPKSGVVLAVGEGALNNDTGERVPLEIKKGDRVLFKFSPYSEGMAELEVEGETVLVMGESDVLAIVE